MMIRMTQGLKWYPCLPALPYYGRDRVSKYGIFLRQSNAAALSVTVVLLMPLVPMLTLVNDSWQGVTKL